MNAERRREREEKMKKDRHVPQPRALLFAGCSMLGSQCWRVWARLPALVAAVRMGVVLMLSDTAALLSVMVALSDVCFAGTFAGSWSRCIGSCTSRQSTTSLQSGSEYRRSGTVPSCAPGT
eukprot:3043809-Rhodomonas_salina.1